MSELQSPEKSLNLIKDEIYGTLREIESNMKIKFSDLESKYKKNFEEFNSKLTSFSVDNKELKDIILPQKLKIEKISNLENFNNKANDMLITHEVRIKNNSDTLTKFQLKYDKLITENLFVPGYIGPSCQFKTLSDYLAYNINEIAKMKLDREQMRKDFIELKVRQETMMKNMITLNESTVQICNTYADGKHNDIKQILNQALERLNQKSFEMRTMFIQFAENAKKLEEKFKEELENIREIKNNISNEIKNNSYEVQKINDEIMQKIKEYNNDMNITKKKLEDITEQLKETNKNINNIKLKNTNNPNNLLINKNKLNLSKSVNPFGERRFKEKSDIKLSLSPKIEEKLFNNDNNNNHNNKNRNKTDLSLESIITENSEINNNDNINDNNNNDNNNDNNNIKKTRDMKVNTNESEFTDLKENKNNTKDNMEYNTIDNINIKIKPKINNDSFNNTKINSLNVNMNKESHRIENIKNKIKNSNNKSINIFIRNKGDSLPTILKKKEKYENLFLEETKKPIDNIYLSPRTKTIVLNKSNEFLKVKNSKIIFHLDNNNPKSFDDNNSIYKEKRRKSSDKIINNKINKCINTNININLNNINNKKVKFTQIEEILEKKESDKLLIKKEKEKKELKMVSLTLPIQENENKKNTKEELSNIMDMYRVNAFIKSKNSNENNIDINNNDEEMLDLPKKVNPFGRTTYNFYTKNDILNHINANNNINNFEYTNNKNKK